MFFGHTMYLYNCILYELFLLFHRYIAVCHPLKAPTISTRSHVIKVIPVLLIVLFAVNSHFIWTVHINMSPFHGKLVPQCSEKDAYKILVTEIWPWVDAFIYSFLPFIVISVMNAIIIYSVVKARKGRNMLQSGGVESNNKYSPTLNGGRHNNTSNTFSGHQDTSYRLTFMLLTISCTFLITTLPVNIMGICAEFLNSKDLAIVTKFRLARTITELLMYCNHSMNFFLYCATGQKFRQQLLMLLCKRKETRYTPSTNILSTAARPAAGSKNHHRGAIGEHHIEEERRRLTTNIDNRHTCAIEMKYSDKNTSKSPQYTTIGLNKKSYRYTCN